MPSLMDLASALLDVFEGNRLKAYQDSGGVWTIGRGHTQGVKAGMIATQAQVDQWFAEDQAPLMDVVKDRAPLEAAALLSFGFNCGKGALLRVLNGELDMQDRVYDRKAHKLDGLVARRRLESVLIAFSRSIE